MTEQQITERPIIFSGGMVLAILSGRKSMTRRIVKPRQSSPKVAPTHMEPWFIRGERQLYDDGRPLWLGYHEEYPHHSKWFACDYGKPGDRLWVREKWKQLPSGQVLYRADGDIVWDEGIAVDGDAWRPSIFMPRRCSRILLEIVYVRVERVQDISEEDAIAEGIEPKEPDHVVSVRYRYGQLWNSINKKRGYSFESNPFVWVISFRSVRP